MGIANSYQKGANNTLVKIQKETSRVASNIFNRSPSQEISEGNVQLGQIKQITKDITGTITGVGTTVAKVLGSNSAISQMLTGQSGSGSGTNGGSKHKEYDQKDITGLKGFYYKLGGHFNDNGVNHVDPLNTFECTFTFKPTGTKIFSGTDIKTSYVQDTLKQNVFRYDINGYKSDGQSAFGKKDAKIVDLGIYIQKIILPSMSVQDKQQVESPIGTYVANGGFVKPDSNTIQMEILNLKEPMVERVFYPWMREVTLPEWQYKEMPYTVATIEIDFTEHSDVKYIFTGCRPTNIQLIQPTQEPSQQMTRQVTFTFNYMFVKSGISKFEKLQYENVYLQAEGSIAKEKEKDPNDTSALDQKEKEELEAAYDVPEEHAAIKEKYAQQRKDFSESTTQQNVAASANTGIKSKSSSSNGTKVGNAITFAATNILKL